MSEVAESSKPKTAVRLDPGDRFPHVTVSRLGGGEIDLPDDVADGWAVILFYRGHWCPFCRKQLEDFQKNLDRFRSNDVQIVALSADPEEEARKTAQTNDLGFPVGFGVDPRTIRDTLGAYLGEDGGFIQATSFILSPEGRVALAVYSSGAVGRLVSRDALGFIDYMRKHEG